MGPDRRKELGAEVQNFTGIGIGLQTPAVSRNEGYIVNLWLAGRLSVSVCVRLLCLFASSYRLFVSLSVLCT